MLVVSRLIGGTLNDFSGLVTSWALEGESFGRPTIEDSSPISFPDSQDLWKSHAGLSGKGLRLKAQGVYLVTFFFLNFSLVALLMCHLVPSSNSNSWNL